MWETKQNSAENLIDKNNKLTQLMWRPQSNFHKLLEDFGGMDEGFQEIVLIKTIKGVWNDFLLDRLMVFCVRLLHTFSSNLVTFIFCWFYDVKEFSDFNFDIIWQPSWGQITVAWNVNFPDSKKKSFKKNGQIFWFL